MRRPDADRPPLEKTDACSILRYMEWGQPMKRLIQILIFFALLTTPLRADNSGVVVRTANVYSAASIASERVGQIGAGARVSVFSRKGGWKEIFAEEQAIIGWVRGYQVREGELAPAAEIKTETDSRGFLSGLASFSRKASSFFKSGSGGTSSGTATIGVRGLSEAEIKSAVADFDELEKMKRFASNQQRMTRFQQQGKLRAHKIAHLERK